MPYVLQGTRDLVAYWNTLGRPAPIARIASAIRISRHHLTAPGRDRVSFNHRYGEPEAQSLAALLGVTVQDVTDNAGQILI